MTGRDPAGGAQIAGRPPVGLAPPLEADTRRFNRRWHWWRNHARHPAACARNRPLMNNGRRSSGFLRGRETPTGLPLLIMDVSITPSSMRRRAMQTQELAGVFDFLAFSYDRGTVVVGGYSDALGLKK